jgi:ABC-2 type transport system permease protein
MSGLGRVARLELRGLLRSRVVRVALAFSLIAGGLAVAHGRGVIERQREALREGPALQAEQHRAVLELKPPTALAGDQLYYLFFHTAHEPSAWAAIALGQRDVLPFNLKVRLLALQGQLQEVDLVSPLLSTYGNFDAAFVLVVLAPLLIIVLTYDVTSVEREGGTWDLARSQGASETVLAGLKLAVRAGVAAGPFLALLAAIPILVGAGWDGRVAALAAAFGAYLLFWVLAAAAVAALRRGSDFNLLTLCGLWLVLTVLAPAVINTWATQRVPIGESLELAVLQRHGYHSAWDRPLDETMEAFYARYPEWRGREVPRDRYSIAWYYAMQQRGDAAAEPAFRAYLDAVERRQALVRRLAAWVPPLALTDSLLLVARTDVDSHLAYLRSVADFHEQLKGFFLPAVFDDRPVSAMDWSAAPRHAFRDEARASAATLVGPHLLHVVGAALVLLGAVRAGRR